MTNFLLVYVTTANQNEATKLAQAAVKARLAACANILPSMCSTYFWQGKLSSADESVLLLKTDQAHYSALVQLLREQHSYEIPCIVALPLAEVDGAYGAWLKGQLGGDHN